MLCSLGKIATLPGDTKIYCGHEYTESNAKFALSIDPENEQLREYAKLIKQLRRKNLPTVTFDYYYKSPNMVSLVCCLILMIEFCFIGSNNFKKRKIM